MFGAIRWFPHSSSLLVLMEGALIWESVAAASSEEFLAIESRIVLLKCLAEFLLQRINGHSVCFSTGAVNCFCDHFVVLLGHSSSPSIHSTSANASSVGITRCSPQHSHSPRRSRSSRNSCTSPQWRQTPVSLSATLRSPSLEWSFTAYSRRLPRA